MGENAFYNFSHRLIVDYDQVSHNVIHNLKIDEYSFAALVDKNTDLWNNSQIIFIKNLR